MPQEHAAIELFVKTVQQYPCLWKTNHKDYRNGDKKDKVWMKIVDLNIPEITDIKTAKLEWKRIRDNHRDSLKRLKIGKKGAPIVNTWKYAQMMEFLLPYMKLVQNKLVLKPTGKEVCDWVHRGVRETANTPLPAKKNIRRA